MVTLNDLRRRLGETQVGLVYLQKSCKEPNDDYDIRMAVFGILKEIKEREIKLKPGAVEMSTNTPGSVFSADFVHDKEASFTIPRYGRVYTDKNDFENAARRLFSRRGYYDYTKTGHWDCFLKDLNKVPNKRVPVRYSPDLNQPGHKTRMV